MAMNPLDISHILVQVFDNLSVWNLKKCRLVCRNWDDEAQLLLQEKSKIVIRTSNDFITCELGELRHICHSLEIDKSVSLGSMEAKSFFKASGKYIKWISVNLGSGTVPGAGPDEIPGVRFDASGWIREVLFEQMQNVEEICVVLPRSFDKEQTFEKTSDIPMLWKVKTVHLIDPSFAGLGDHIVIWRHNVFHFLFTMFNLERLMFMPSSELRALLFFEAIQSVPLKRLTHLHINKLVIGSPEVQWLIKKNFHLVYFHFVITPTLTRQTLENLLYHLVVQTKGTLKELTITFLQGATCSMFHPLPYIEGMKLLSHMGYEGILQISKTTRMDTLRITLPDPNELPVKLEEFQVNANLQELQIYDLARRYVPSTIESILKPFPLLTKLVTNYVDCTILRLIYQCCPLIRDLQVMSHEFYGRIGVSNDLEIGLCGVRKEAVENNVILSALAVNRWSISTEGIWRLQHLKRLSLESVKLRDFGIIYGICKCTGLEQLTLKLSTSAFSKSFTVHSLRAIATELNLYYLKLEGFTFTDEEINELKSSMLSREVHVVNAPKRVTSSMD